MAFRIPVIEQRVVPEAASPNVAVDSLDYGNIGGSIAQAGRVVQTVANDTLRQIADAEDGDYVATQMADLTAAEDAGLVEAQRAAPAGAKGFTKSYMGGFDSRLQARLKAAPSDRARKALQERATSLRLAVHRDSLKFEYESGATLRRANMDEGASKLLNVALSRPEMYGELSAQLDDMAALYAPEMTQQELADWKRGASQKLATARFQGAIEADPAGAKRELDSGAWDDRLDPGDKARLLNASDAEIKRREAEARQRQREAEADARARRQELQFTARLNYADELAAAANGESAHPDVEKQIALAYEPDEAGPLIERLRMAREEGGIAKGLSTVPTAELPAVLESMAPGGAGYADEAERQARLAKLSQDVVARRAADPAAEAARSFPEIAQGLASDDPATVAQAVRRSVEVQRTVFGLPDDKVQPLGKAGASRIVEQWKLAPTTDEKLAVLASVVNMPGADGKPDDALGSTVLSQLEAAGLPPGAERAVEAYRGGDVSRARDLVNALAIDPKDVPTPDVTPQQITEAIDARTGESGGLAVDAGLAFVTGQPTAVSGYARSRDLVHRVTKQKIAAGADPETAAAQAEAIVYGGGPAIADTSLGFVRLPQGSDVDAVTQGLETLRSRIVLPAPPAEAGSIEALRNTDRERHVREYGTFANFGDGFALIDPQTQRLIPGADGKPQVWSLSDVLAAGLGETTQQQDMVAP